VTQLEDALDIVKLSMRGLYKLAADGTAVGRGLNAMHVGGSYENASSGQSR
jgi:fumarate hydratase, class II